MTRSSDNWNTIPWRLRIADCFVRGFLKDPAKALRYGRGIVPSDMSTVMRFNLHIHGEDFLKQFLDEAAKLGIRPFLMWGSLLGCIREGGFIDNDNDLDVGILAKDYSKKDALIRAMLKRGHRLRHDVPFKFSIETKDRLLNIDVDVLYEHKGRLINNMPHEKTGKGWSHHFPKDAFREVKSARLGNLTVWVPGNCEAVLEASYGNWRVPEKNYTCYTGPRNKIQDPESEGIGSDNMPFKAYTHAGSGAAASHR
jgi:hypothetical protein